MQDDDEVTIWINALAYEKQESAQKIWASYYQKILTVARRKLKDMPRRHLDEEDIATEAMNSLFNGIQAGRFPDLNDREDLWKILLTITARKAGKAIRSNLTQKRGGGSTRGESVFDNPNKAESAAGLANFLGREPTMEMAEDVAKSCEDLLNQLGDPILESIALKKLEGFSNEEIADSLNVVVRTVERKLNRIRNIWGDLN